MTLKDAKRICKDNRVCIECPLYSDTYHMCVIKNRVPQDYDLDAIDSHVRQWLKEHPEPVYPTYYNWLTGEGVYDFGERISEEFAEKHNIKPIE